MSETEQTPDVRVDEMLARRREVLSKHIMALNERPKDEKATEGDLRALLDRMLPIAEALEKSRPEEVLSELAAGTEAMAETVSTMRKINADTTKMLDQLRNAAKIEAERSSLLPKGMEAAIHTIQASATDTRRAAATVHEERLLLAKAAAHLNASVTSLRWVLVATAGFSALSAFLAWRG